MTVLGKRDADKVAFAEFIVKFFSVYSNTGWRSPLYRKAVKFLRERAP